MGFETEDLRVLVEEARRERVSEIVEGGSGRGGGLGIRLRRWVG